MCKNIKKNSIDKGSLHGLLCYELWKKQVSRLDIF